MQTTTEKQLRKQLEEHFNCDLKDRKPIFKEEIESFLLKNQDLFDAEDDDAELGEDEKPKKKKRTGVGMRQSLSEQMQSFLGTFWYTHVVYAYHRNCSHHYELL